MDCFLFQESWALIFSLWLKIDKVLKINNYLCRLEDIYVFVFLLVFYFFFKFFLKSWNVPHKDVLIVQCSLVLFCVISPYFYIRMWYNFVVHWKVLLCHCISFLWIFLKILYETTRLKFLAKAFLEPCLHAICLINASCFPKWIIVTNNLRNNVFWVYEIARLIFEHVFVLSMNSFALAFSREHTS